MYDSKKQTIVLILSVALAFLCIYGVKHIKVTYFSETVTTQKPTPKPTKPIVTTTEEPTTEETTTEKETEPYVDINMLFAGNVSLQAEAIESIPSENVITEELSATIKNSDFSMFNLQTAIASNTDLDFGNTSTNYIDTSNKDYIKNLGFSGAALANNYILECGMGTVNSTRLALDSINMFHTGMGSDLSEAKKPIITEINGKKISIISTTRSYPDESWEASNKNIFIDEDISGVFTCKDTDNITELILEQKDSCDFVIVYMNCGNENTEELDNYQQYLAHTLVDAGANLIIGCSPNMVQGIEYYNNVPIIYSLGTFLTSESDTTSALLSVIISEDNKATCTLLPCTLEDSSVATLDDEQKTDFYDRINELSENMNAQVSDKGVISPIE
ncbi:MAG: CapA family protein [Lachnospiraceae bacterium]|nr:CapA family protein [Lachnospiraceae bacterium]MBQ4068223.1 CapA family protein [Lachnospiraceae bacterium]